MNKIVMILIMLSALACEKMPVNPDISYKRAVTGFFNTDTSSTQSLFIGGIADVKDDSMYFNELIEVSELEELTFTIDGEIIPFEIEAVPYFETAIERCIRFIFPFRALHEYRVQIQHENGYSAVALCRFPGQINPVVEMLADSSLECSWAPVTDAMAYCLSGAVWGIEKDHIIRMDDFVFDWEINSDNGINTIRQTPLQTLTHYTITQEIIQRNLKEAQDRIDREQLPLKLHSYTIRFYACPKDMAVYLTEDSYEIFEAKVISFDYSNLDGNCVGLISGYTFSDYTCLLPTH